MAYDYEGNYIDDSGMGPNPDFAVQPQEAPATASNFAVQTGSPPASGYLTEKDFTYTPPSQTTETQEGYYDTEGNYVAPYNDPYKGGFLSYNGRNFAVPILHEAGNGFATPYYEARTNTGDLAAAVMAGEGQAVRLLDGAGNVIYQGLGPTGARDVASVANQLSLEGGKNAAWNIQIEDPANKGVFNSAGYESVDKAKNHTLRNLIVDIVPQVVAAIATGGTSLGWQMAAAAAATIPGDIVQKKSLTDSIFRAATAATTAGVLKGTDVGKSITSGITKGVGNITNSFAPAVTDAAASTAQGTVEGVTVTGSQLPNIIRGSLTGLSGGAGQEVLQGGTNGDPITSAPPSGTVSEGTPLVDAATQTQVDELVVLGKKLGATITPEILSRALAQGITSATLPEWLRRQGLTQEVQEVDVNGNRLPRDPFNPVIPPANYNVDPADIQQPLNPTNLNTKVPNPPLSWSAKALEFIRTHPLEAARLGLTAVNSLSKLGGGSGGSGGSGVGFKTIDEQQKALPSVFHSQLGAPRGLFSALGTAGTPYEPRPISNLTVPSGGAPSGGSSGPSGIDAAAAYLARYPDVLDEANKNPGAYGDVNDDGVIDNNDFALMHYMLHGQAEGRTMKTGGYIEDKPMRFQVLHKAGGGVVDSTLMDDFVPKDPATNMPMTDRLGNIQQLFSVNPPATQPNANMVVDPRALAETYRSQTPADLSVFTSAQSPYSGYTPGTMGGMYHYGEAPTGEAQHFNYALAPGAVAPWMAETPTGAGVYNMFGVKVGGAGAGAGGAPTGGTGTGTTGGTTTTQTPAPISDAERAKWAAYVNAYPDLAAAFISQNNAYGDFNHDGKIDIADFGLGHYTNYGSAEGRSLTGPATGKSTGSETPIIEPAPPRSAAISDAELARMFPTSGYFDPTSPVYDPSGGMLRWDIDNLSALDPLSGTYRLVSDALSGAGYSHGGSTFAVKGDGTGRSDSIPARLSDGEYVIDAETVALLGDGSSEAGAKKLDQFRVNVRKHKGSSLAKGKFSADAKDPEKYLSGGRS